MKQIIHIGLQQLTQKVIWKEIKSNIYIFLSESDLKMSHCSDVQIYIFCNIANMHTFYMYLFIYLFILIWAVNAHLNMLAWMCNL